MAIRNIDAMCDDYGADAVFLIGGALLAQDRNLVDGTRAFMDAILTRFSERLVVPAEPTDSELDNAGALQRYLPVEGDFQWRGRESSAYKDAGDLAFKGVRRS